MESLKVETRKFHGSWEKKNRQGRAVNGVSTEREEAEVDEAGLQTEEERKRAKGRVWKRRTQGLERGLEALYTTDPQETATEWTLIQSRIGQRSTCWGKEKSIPPQTGIAIFKTA